MKSKPTQLDLFEQAPDMNRKPCKGRPLNLTTEQKRARKRALDKISKNRREPLKSTEQVAKDRAAAKAYRVGYYRTHKAKIREKRKKWEASNPDKVRAAQVRYKERHPDGGKIQYHKDIEHSRAQGRKGYHKAVSDPKKKADRNAKARQRAPKYAPKKKLYNQQYSARHPEKVREKTKRSRKKNPHLFSAAQSRRRTKHLSATPKWVDHKAINLVYRNCRDARNATGIKHAVDHIVPLIHPNVCGLHVHWNLQVLTFSDNAKKRNSFIEALGIHPTVANGLIHKEAAE